MVDHKCLWRNSADILYIFDEYSAAAEGATLAMKDLMAYLFELYLKK